MNARVCHVHITPFMLAEAQDLPPEKLLEALPESLKDLDAVLSVSEILKLIEYFGGTTIAIPLTPTDDGELVKVLGMDAAQRLSGFCGGENINVPRGHKIRRMIRIKRIKELRNQGFSIDALASQFQVTSRAIYLALSDN